MSRLSTVGISGARPPKVRQGSQYAEFLALAEHCRHLLVNVFQERVVIVHGDAVGIDTVADIASREAGHTVVKHIPDYVRYSGRTAPLERNTLIIKDVVADPRGELHAFPASHSSGTFDTIQKMALEDLSKLWVHYYDPDLKEVVRLRSSEAVSYLRSLGHEIKLHANSR